MVPSIFQSAGETFWIASGEQETSSSPDVCVDSLHGAPVSPAEVCLRALWSLLRTGCEAKATVKRYY